MKDEIIPAILRVPTSQLERFRQMATEACKEAALPTAIRRLPLPFVPVRVLEKLGSEEEADIAARLIEELALRLDAAAARNYKQFMDDERMARSSAAIRAKCLLREPIIELEVDEDEECYGKDPAIEAVQVIWRLLVSEGVVLDAQDNSFRHSYAFTEDDSVPLEYQEEFSFEEVRTKAIEDWRALQKSKSRARPRLNERRHASPKSS